MRTTKTPKKILPFTGWLVTWVTFFARNGRKGIILAFYTRRDQRQIQG